jgi:hypothetical protein
MCLTCAGPCHFGPAWTSDIIILDTPRGDLNEISSSSYGLSLFSLKADSHPDEGTSGGGGCIQWVVECECRGALAED